MPAADLDLERLGQRLNTLRRSMGLTLAELAEVAGVSRSMISEVERGSRTPTVLVLDRLATGLRTSIARLLREEQQAGEIRVIRHAEQDVLRDPSGWERRILSPVLAGVEFEFMRTTLGPGVDAGVFGPHPPGSREYVAVETGILRLTLDGQEILLGAGDSIYYAGDCAHGFAHAGPGDCIYYLAMDVAVHPSHH